jgi:hypothetical protein
MGKYGDCARESARLAASGMHPPDAWEKVSASVFGGGTWSQRKGCPRGAFLGLCSVGLVRGVPARHSGPSAGAAGRNGGYAVKAVRILRISPELASDKRALWARVMEGEEKRHNEQMDVVLALFNDGLIVDRPDSVPENA